MYQSGCTDARPTEACSAPVVDASRDFYLIFSPNEQCRGGGGGYAARRFRLFSFPCPADHERDVFCFFRVGAECEKQKGLGAF